MERMIFHVKKGDLGAGAAHDDGSGGQVVNTGFAFNNTTFGGDLAQPGRGFTAR